MRKCMFLILSAISLILCCSCTTKPIGNGNEAFIGHAEAPDELTLPEDFWSLVDGSTATIPISEALYERFGGTGEIVHNKTFNAYNNLLNGKAKLVFALEPSDDILNLFKEKNIEIELIPIVKDAFILFVNTENPINDLTIPQLRDIYTGNIVNWKTFGGDDLTIIPYQRNTEAGSQALFLMLLMQDIIPVTPPTEYIQTSMKDIIDSVAYEDRGKAAIGFNVFYYANEMYGNDKIRIIQVEGIEPNQKTISDGEYPLDTFYYAVIRKDMPQDDPARQLIDFILTDEGQGLMREAGYVPVKPLE